MAIPTNTLVSSDNVGNREDLIDVIARVAPEKTPVLSAIGSGKADGSKHEWQTEDLDSVDGDNKHLDGDDTAADAANLTTRLDNQCQIMKKAPAVSGRTEAVKKAGRKSEMARQVKLKSLSLKRDMEARITGNYSKVAGTNSVPGECAGMEAWLTSNVSRGTGGASNAQGTAATDGTQRPFTEDLLVSVLESCHSNGAQPNMIFAGIKNKGKFNAFAGRAQTVVNAENTKTVHGSVSFYESDIGMLKIVPNQHMRDRSVLVIDPKYWKTCYLRKFKVEDLSKTGDSWKKQLLVDFTIEALNEKSSGVIADLTTT